MLLRAVGRGASSLATCARHTVASRYITVSRPVLGGGGHHHDPVPVYIPKPGSLEWSVCGTPGAKRVSEETKYTPGKEDYKAFVGAAVFVGLTITAVAIYTDLFKKDTGHHGHAKEHKKEHVVAEPELPKVEEAAAAGPVSKNEGQFSAEAVAENIEKEAVKKELEKTEAASSSHEVEEIAQKAAESAQGVNRESQGEELKPEPVAVEETKPAVEETSEAVTEEVAKEGLQCEYVIIGSGTAAYYASLAIRAKQGEAKVLMIGEETELPYNRPPLSKELWWYGDEDSNKKLNYTALSGKKRDIFYEVEGFFVKPDELSTTLHGGVSLLRGVKATKVCTKDKKVYLEDGSTVSYGKLLIATGNRPQRVKIFDEASEEAQKKITYYHYPADFKRVAHALTEESAKHVTVIGSGLLASELAYSIKRKYGDVVDVYQVYEEKANIDDLLPEHLAKKSREALKEMGVKIHSEEKIDGVRKCCKNVVLKLKDGSELRTDLIIVAKGSEVNSDLAEASGITLNEKDRGIQADATLKVSDEVWAAGAAVSFDDITLGEKRRLDSWEHAQISGRLAGENMTGADGEGKKFWYQPSFFTKFAPHLHFNAVGRIDSSLDTVSVYAEPQEDSKMEKAVVFYKDKQDGRIVGVLLLNVFGPSLDVARRIIDDKKKIDDLKELSKLFPLYEVPKADEPKSEEPKSEVK